MYPLGILFGLGFDASSEVALLGISSVEAARGTSFWVILIYPALFTGLSPFPLSTNQLTKPAGMCLLDTTDGALMLSLYVQPAKNFLAAKHESTEDSTDPDAPLNTTEEIDTTKNHRDPVAFLYYSIVLTMLTVIVAIVIGVIQLLSLIQTVANLEGGFWDGVQTASDYYDVIGGAICGCFVVVGILSVLLYRPWRRRMDRTHGKMPQPVDDVERYRDEVDDGPGAEGDEQDGEGGGKDESGKGPTAHVTALPAGSSTS